MFSVNKKIMVIQSKSIKSRLGGIQCFPRGKNNHEPDRKPIQSTRQSYNIISWHIAQLKTLIWYIYLQYFSTISLTKFTSFLYFSFHVGSGCYDATAFSAAVASARTVFDIGKDVGFNMELLDIGGGFPGQASAKISFEEVGIWFQPFGDVIRNRLIEYAIYFSLLPYFEINFENDLMLFA